MFKRKFNPVVALSRASNDFKAQYHGSVYSLYKAIDEESRILKEAVTDNSCLLEIDNKKGCSLSLKAREEMELVLRFNPKLSVILDKAYAEMSEVIYELFKEVYADHLKV